MKYWFMSSLMCLLVALPATAQTVYRCGNEYTREPCAQGKAVEATAPGSAAQRAEARQVAAREQRLAAQMRQDRLKEEAAIRPALAGSLSGSTAKEKEMDFKPKKKHPKKPRGVAKERAELSDS
jgi:hypothetical protein